MTKTPAKKIKVLSPFTGIGGLDLGFEKAGFDVVVSVDRTQFLMYDSLNFKS